MQRQLISHSADLKKLYDEGYQIEVGGGHLLVHHLPYLNPNREVRLGTLVCVLTLASPTRAGAPPDHTAHFIGELPTNADGTAMTAIVNNSNAQQLTDSITVNHYFSSKPASGNYADYYEKVRTYAEILLAQALTVDSTVTARPNRKKENGNI